MHHVIFWVALLLGATGCASRPATPPAVTGFDIARYTGTWYEIARLPNRFERGLTGVSATYSPRPDGGVTVLNRGYSAKAAKWKSATGRAFFTGPREVAALRVTFFWPFYGGYRVIRLDDQYRWAVVASDTPDYLWLLSRTPTLPSATTTDFTDYARSAGFAVDRLEWVDQSQPTAAAK